MAATSFSKLIRQAQNRCRTQRTRRNIQSRILARSLERLEARTVPTGLLVSYVTSGNSNTRISGTVYDDTNGNGIRDGGEDGKSGWRVYLDLDQSSTWNTDEVGDIEPSSVTNVDGDFVISHLQPGTYRVAQVVQTGWNPTSQAFNDINVVSDKESKTSFLDYAGGNLIGTVWNDLNHDGVRAKDPVTGAYTDPGLDGWQVYLDDNKNNTLDSGEAVTLTDSNGAYSFVNISAVEYRVAEVRPAGWDIAPTFDDHQDAFVSQLMSTTQDFANFSLTNGSISGTIWNDLNADGIRATDAGGKFTDPGLSNWTIFLDLNLNGAADVGEPTTKTDGQGSYKFSSLTAGDYDVTQVLPAGWNLSPMHDISQTVSVNAGSASTAPDFANFTVLNGSIRGVVWNDLNRNGIRDTTISGTFTEPGLSGWSVFLDLNRSTVRETGEPLTMTNASGEYTFTDLQVGDYEVRELLPIGWESAPTFDVVQTVTVFSGTESIAGDFANINLATTVPGSISGTTWNDVNGNGLRDADDNGQSGRVVFIDANNNGIFDAGELGATSSPSGTYSINGITPGTVRVVQQAKTGWQYSAPMTGLHTVALKNAGIVTGIDFGNHALTTSAIHGAVFSDKNHDGIRQASEPGLSGITVYLDANHNGALDAGEQQTTTAPDLYYTPSVNEAGAYGFTHLAEGAYTVRIVVPVTLSATPAGAAVQSVTLAFGDDHGGVDFAAQYRPSEIHGKRFDDKNGNHIWDAGEPVVAGVKIYIDSDRDNMHDPGEPETETGADGSYSFVNLPSGAYVVREVENPEFEPTYPNTKGGILWPAGVSNPAVGNVSPTSITFAVAQGQSYNQSVSITLPNTGSITNMVDVFLLFDDTGSFVNNSPIVRAAFPTIISQLQAALPGTDLGFGVGRLEEYANFAYEYATGRPFTLNQPIVASSTAGYMTAIQAALNRTTPGYGGDTPETDIEALYQLVTGLGFDGNNNGSVLDSGPAGLASTQLNPGASGDVPSFASFMADPANSVLPAAGNIGGGGFRAGALPIILLATDTGFAYQPYGETAFTGLGGLSVPISMLTQASRPSTPFNYGAGFQQTITGLNALGALVVGLGTNVQLNLDPRQGLSALSRLTGAINRSTTTIANGTATPIAPGDPLYFQISSGFASSVANGVVSAIQNGATTVAMDIDVIASDPRVHIVNHSGVHTNVGAGQTASFDIEFVGDGIPARFDLKFVRAGTNVVLGSIPVVMGTPIPGDCYEFEDMEEGEIESEGHFGGRRIAPAAPPRVSGITINGGAAQRSIVNGMSVAFDQHVTLLGLPASAFQLVRHSDGAVVSLAATVNDAGAGTVVNFTFAGGAVDGASLQDGRYDLTVIAASVSNVNGQLDGNGDGTAGDNYTLIGDPATNKVFRLFGDVNGDGAVAASDFSFFRQFFGGVNIAFDFDNDGSVSASDFTQFRMRFGGSI